MERFNCERVSGVQDGRCNYLDIDGEGNDWCRKQRKALHKVEECELAYTVHKINKKEVDKMPKREKIVIVEFVLKELYIESGIVMRTFKKHSVSGQLDRAKRVAIFSALSDEEREPLT